jgi:predicted HTH transcriptional regulator
MGIPVAQLRRWVAAGESQILEFKQRFSSPVAAARSLAALANTAGGVILVGIGDDGSPAGLEDPEECLKLVNQVAAFHLDPPLNVLTELVHWGSAAILVIEVPNSDHKPHALHQLGQYSGRVYLRQGAATVPAGSAQIKLLQKRGDPPPDLNLAALDPMERLLIEYLTEHERITLRQFCKIANCSKRRAQRILVNYLQAGILNVFENERDPVYSLGIPLDQPPRTGTHSNRKTVNRH